MTIPEVSRAELQSLLAQNSATVVEALPEDVYESGHLPGARNIRPRRTEELAPVLLSDRDATIVVYCGSERCDASLRVANRLDALGYRDVRRYTGGKEDWVAAGLPVVVGPDAPPDAG